MSVSQELDRIQIATNNIRTKLQSLGVAQAGDNITTMAQNIQVLERPTGQQGQVVGFTDTDEIGAVDAPIPAGYTTLRLTLKDENGNVTLYDVLGKQVQNNG